MSTTDDLPLTLGERAADVIRNGMGSWRFVGFALFFLAGWIAGVTLWHWPINNPQLTILNLGLSCLAALQGSILLIAARRQDEINSRILQRDLSLDESTSIRLAALCEQHDMLHRDHQAQGELLAKVAAKVGVDG